MVSSQERSTNMVTKEDSIEAEEKSKVTMKLDSKSKKRKKSQNDKLSELANGKVKQASPTKTNGSVSKKAKKEEGNSEKASETNEAAFVQESAKCSRKSKRKQAPRSSRHSIV